MANRPITDADREKVRTLHGAGRTRNDIAREIGRSSSTVSKIAADLGLSFDRAATAAATAAKSADLAARRVTLAERLHDDAERLREQLWQPHTYFDWGGKDHSFDKHTAPEPTPADKRSLMGAVSVAIDKSLKLVPPRDEQGAADAVSMLDQLAAGIRQLAAAAQQEEADGEG